MNITLNDQKILKIVYQLDDKNTVNFNYENGELVSITSNKSSSQKVDELKKMFSIAKEPDFLEKVKKIVEEPSKKTVKEQIEALKMSDESLKKARQIIKMDENGELDGMLKKMNEHSGNDLLFKPIKEICKQDTAESIDKMICYKSLKQLKEKLLNTLREKEISQDDNDFWEIIKQYQRYNNALRKLQDEEWDKLHAIE